MFPFAIFRCMMEKMRIWRILIFCFRYFPILSDILIFPSPLYSDIFPFPIFFRLHYFLIFFRFAIFRYSGCVRRWNTASSSFCSMKRRLLSYWKCISVFIRATDFNIVLQNNEISAQSQWIYSAKSFLFGWAVVGNKVWINCNIDAL